MGAQEVDEVDDGGGGGAVYDAGAVAWEVVGGRCCVAACCYGDTYGAYRLVGCAATGAGYA